MAFKDSVVVVTGGSRGIGRAIAEAFLRKGSDVVVADIAPYTSAYKERVRFVKTDVSCEQQVKRLMEQAGPVIDVLVNNAGISCFGPLESVPVSEFDRVIAVNLRGPYLCSRYAAPALRASGRGAIVNIASSRALMSEPGGEAYGASKGGLVALTHALSLSLGPSIRVNCISPGWIDTSDERFKALSSEDHSQHPVGRVGQTTDIAEACLFLADAQKSGFITGQNIIIDGGMTRKMIYV